MAVGTARGNTELVEATECAMEKVLNEGTFNMLVEKYGNPGISAPEWF